MNTELHFKSEKQDWETPQDFYDELDAEFHFNLDACATAENTKCDNFISPEMDAFTRDWHGTVWMNPPYGRACKKWVSYAFEQAMMGHCTVVCLLAARTDTDLFHRYAAKGEIRFIKGRLQFVGAADPAPFPSMIVIFRPPAPPSTRYAVMNANS